MKKVHFIATLLMAPLLVFAQSYLPLAKGNKWEYGMGNHSFVDEIVQDNVSINGKSYFKKVRTVTYSESGVHVDSTFLRVANDGTIRILDPKSMKEMNWIPANPSVGQSWPSTDNEWKFTVVEVSTTFHGFKKSYENCIVIKEQNTNDPKQNIYFHYYSKGLGYAGMKVSDGNAIWLEKWSVR